MSEEYWIGEQMREAHREWFASLTLADIEARWIGDGIAGVLTLTEYMEYLARG